MTHTILHVIPSLSRGGIVTQVLQLTTNLPPGEFTQNVVSLDRNRESIGDFQARGVEPVVLGQRSPFDPVALWKFQRLVSQSRPQIIHAWSPAAQWTAAVAGIVSGPKAMVVSERKVRTASNNRRSPATSWLARNTARLIANAEAVRSNCIARGIEPDKISMIVPGVAFPQAASSRTTPGIKAELNLPETAKVIVCIGSLSVEKRLKELIWGTDQLHAVGIEAHLLLVGEGALKEQLERYARLNHIRHRVHFLGPRSDVQNVLSQSDVLWHAGASEGQSSAILEAMSAGLPVVAAESCGACELVVPGQTGFLVPLGERAGFARWTLPLLENAALAKQLGAAGRALAHAHHSVEQMVARFAQVYREVLEKSR